MSMRLLIVAFSLLMAGTYAQNQAAASCGDWLANPAPMAAANHASTSPLVAADTESVPLPSAPCNGPGCRRGPLVPVPSPPVPPSSESQRVVAAVVVAPGWTDDLAAAHAAWQQTLHPLSGYPLGVDRPPSC